MFFTEKMTQGLQNFTLDYVIHDSRDKVNIIPYE